MLALLYSSRRLGRPTLKFSTSKRHSMAREVRWRKNRIPNPWTRDKRSTQLRVKSPSTKKKKKPVAKVITFKPATTEVKEPGED